MREPIFWLALSLILVAISLTTVLVAAIPTFHELSRASRSAEKLFETLNREFPPTLDAIRLTGLEITELTEDINEGVKSASSVVQNFDQSITNTKQQVKQISLTTRSVFTGFKVAWQTWHHSSSISKAPAYEQEIDKLE